MIEIELQSRIKKSNREMKLINVQHPFPSLYSNLFQFHWNLDNFSRKYLNFRIFNKLDIRITQFIRSQSILILFKSYTILYYAIHGIFPSCRCWPLTLLGGCGCECVSVVNLKGFSWFYRLFWHNQNVRRYV